MPAFEGLFLDTRVDDFVQDLLFELAMFYTFARLAMHTEGTLHAFDLAVVSLGKAMRNFLAKVCPKFDTRKLSGETESCQRRRQRKGKMDVTGPKHKGLNLNTYKYHRLGDYPRMVRELGTLDNYSTQLVSRKSGHWTITNVAS